MMKYKKKIVEKLLNETNVISTDDKDDNYDRNFKKVILLQSEISKILEQGLEQFINQNSMNFFRKLQSETDWLKINCENWLENENYQSYLSIVKNLSVVNDVAERGVHLMQEYNPTRNKNL